jgi:hypothetical protein
LPFVGGETQLSVQVTLSPAIMYSERVHFWCSFSPAGGLVQTFAAQTFAVRAGISIGRPSIDILEVTSQRSPLAGVSAARRGSEPSRSNVAAAARRGYRKAMAASPDS